MSLLAPPPISLVATLNSAPPPLLDTSRADCGTCSFHAKEAAPHLFSHMAPIISKVAKPLRDLNTKPAGTPDGLWFCKACSRFLSLDRFNPASVAMQYKYLCIRHENERKAQQGARFRRGTDGGVNPMHPRHVGARKRQASGMPNGMPNLKTKPTGDKRRRRGRQWSSVNKAVQSFDAAIDWKLVALGIRGRTVKVASNFTAGTEFATEDLQTRFIQWLDPAPQPSHLSQVLERIGKLGRTQKELSNQLSECQKQLLALNSSNLL